ncbi:MAG: FtsX-like permease family protein [bacterium]
MKPHFLRLIRRDIQFHPWLWIFSILGVAIGVAGWVGMDYATNRAVDSLQSSLRSTLGNATHLIEDRTGSLDEGRYLKLARQTSITMTPVIEDAARIRQSGKQGTRTVKVVGIDPITYPAIGAYETSESPLPVGKMISGRRLLILPRTLRSMFSPGETISMYIGGSYRKYQVAGFVDSRGEDVVYMDIGRAQADLGRPGELSRILIRHDQKPEWIKEELQSNEVIRPVGQQTRSVRSLITAFQWNLKALAFLSLFVGAFLVYCSMVLYKTRQRRMLSLLRTLGVSSGEVLLLSLLSVATLGLAGTIIGLGLGLTLGGLLSEGVLRTVNRLYVPLYAQSGGGVWWTLGTGFLFGGGISVFGGLEPILRNWSVPPREWVRTKHGSYKNRTFWKPAGLAVLFIVLAWLLIFYTSRSLIAGFTACFFVALAGAGFGIFVMMCSSKLELGSLWGRMSRRNLALYGRRTGVVLATLVIAFSMVLSVMLMVGSFRSTVRDWVHSVVRADFYVRSEPVRYEGAGRRLNSRALQSIKTITGVKDVVKLARKTVYTRNNKPIEIRGIETNFWNQRRDSLFQFNDSVNSPWDRLQEGALLLSEPGAYRLNKSAGDRLNLPVQSGNTISPKIVGVFNDYSTEWAIVYMDYQQMKSIYPDASVRDAAIFVQSGRDPRKVGKRVRKVSDKFGYYYQPGWELRRRAMENFERTFSVTEVMNVIASIVAAIGLIVTFVALYKTREYEFGQLRATGCTREQVGGLLGWESFHLILYTLIASLPTGYLLSYLLIYVINRRSFGWLIEFSPGFQSVGMILIMVFVSGTVALVFPLYKLYNTPLYKLEE